MSFAHASSVCLIAIVATTTVTYIFNHHLIGWLERPLHGKKVVAFDVTEPFLTTFWIALWAGLLLATPIVFWQVWGFFAPAFDNHSQRKIVGFAFFAAGLMVAGVAFGYFIVLDPAVSFLTNYNSSQFHFQPRANSYFSFVTLVMVATAIVFELPVFILALARIGILPADRLRKNRRLGYVIVAAIAVALPGVDPVTTTLEMIPMLILFEGLDLARRLLRPALEARRRREGRGLGRRVPGSVRSRRDLTDYSDRIRALALSFPETYEDEPWGHPVFKVADNRMFAALSSATPVSLTVKLTTEEREIAGNYPFAGGRLHRAWQAASRSLQCLRVKARRKGLQALRCDGRLRRPRDRGQSTRPQLADKPTAFVVAGRGQSPKRRRVKRYESLDNQFKDSEGNEVKVRVVGELASFSFPLCEPCSDPPSDDVVETCGG